MVTSNAATTNQSRKAAMPSHDRVTHILQRSVLRFASAKRLSPVQTRPRRQQPPPVKMMNTNKLRYSLRAIISKKNQQTIATTNAATRSQSRKLSMPSTDFLKKISQHVSPRFDAATRPSTLVLLPWLTPTHLT